MLAYYETVRNGLVPVKVVSMVRETSGLLRIEVTVTAAKAGYNKGETITSTGLHIVPRHAIRQRKYHTFIMPFSWQNEAEKASFKIDQDDNQNAE